MQSARGRRFGNRQQLASRVQEADEGLRAADKGLMAMGCRRRAFGALASLAEARGVNVRAEAGGRMVDRPDILTMADADHAVGGQDYGRPGG